ncbi:MAG TPA: hypothetical protein VG815_05410 [Chloroflexota bacterium]|jgi:hypothetical protein|nr:hypothetical protein [Chloroflexota bacterium]
MAAQAPSHSRFEFIHDISPHVRQHREQKPVKVHDQVEPGLNGKIAIALTKGVGTMWCAYGFALLALIALPSALQGGTFAIIQWISQTFIQLVMLSVIMVGQNILGAASDKRAEDTYKDADATFHAAHQIQAHLDLQDKHLQSQDDRLGAIIEALKQAFPAAAAELDKLGGMEPTPTS